MAIEDFEFKLVSDIDIKRCAHILLKQHGKDAWKYADSRMLRLIGENDAKGASVWMTIAHCIEQITLEREQGKHLTLCVNHSQKN